MTKREFDKIRGDEEKLCLTVYTESLRLHSDRGIEGLSPERIAAYVALHLFYMTRNGGFQSFFYGAEVWPVRHVVAALNQVGLPKYASVLERASKILFPKGIPASDSQYNQDIDTLYEVFEASDEADEYDDPFEKVEEGFWQLYNANKKEFRATVYGFLLHNAVNFVSE